MRPSGPPSPHKLLHSPAFDPKVHVIWPFSAPHTRCATTACCLNMCEAWGGRRGLPATLTRLEPTLIRPEHASTDARVLAVTLAPADGWDSPLGQQGAEPPNYREIEHERREEESRAIAAELDAKSADMRLHLAGQSSVAQREPPEEWLVHWQALSSGAAARSGGAAVVAAAPAAPCCTVCMTGNQVELRSSAPDGGIADTAAGLSLEICAREVVFELPPGVSMWSSGPGGLRESESEAVVRLLAAWIRASGARSVWLKPGHAGRHADAAEPAAVMVLKFSTGKQSGVQQQQLVLGLVVVAEPWLKRLGARYQLSCTSGVNLDGSACGLLFDPML